MTVPLTRNRDYRLLWFSQALSEFGQHASTIALPLLVLAVTRSTAVSGLVLGTVAAAQLLAGLPGGALVDRWNRKRILLGCEAAQAVAVGSLAVALWRGTPSVAHFVAVAAVLGVCAALFEPAEEATLATVVPAGQLATAVAMNGARSSMGQLAGTAAGGFLYAVARALPFAVDAATHVAGFVMLTALRVPPRTAARAPVRHLGREIAAGLRWAWAERQIRFTTGCVVVLNLFFTAFYIVVIVLAGSRGVPAGEIGVMAAMLGAGGILGAFAAPYLQRRLGPYLSVVAVFWAVTVLTPLTSLTGSGYVIGALFAGMALLAPTANTTIITRQLMLTPDDLRGRLSAVTGLAGGVAAALGPVLGGLLTTAVPGRAAVLICAAGLAVVTLFVTVSPVLRKPAPPAGFIHITEGDTIMDDDARYEVLRNDEDQYSLWPGRAGGAGRLAPGRPGGHPGGVLRLRRRGLDRHAPPQPARAHGSAGRRLTHGADPSAISGGRIGDRDQSRRYGGRCGRPIGIPMRSANMKRSEHGGGVNRSACRSLSLMLLTNAGGGTRWVNHTSMR